MKSDGQLYFYSGRWKRQLRGGELGETQNRPKTGEKQTNIKMFVNSNIKVVVRIKL